MERVIKFRGISLETNEFVHGDLINLINNSKRIVWEQPCGEMPFPDLEVKNHLVNPDTIGQLTGLTDKNGKDIYEGDVVEWENEATGINGKSKIRYSSRLARYEVQDGDTWYQMNPITIKYTVIGNLFENPELLSTDKTKTV